MIVLDSSAIIAILSSEPGNESLLAIVANTDHCALSALTFFETALVLFARKREAGLQDLAKFLEFTEAEIIPFDQIAAQAALEAFKAFGKGIRPSAVQRPRFRRNRCRNSSLIPSRLFPAFRIAVVGSSALGLVPVETTKPPSLRG